MEARGTRQRRTNCEGGEGNSCGNSGIAMLISWMRMRVVVDGFECSFWSNRIVDREGNVYLVADNLAQNILFM